MKINWRGEALSLTILAVMFVVAAASWSLAPDQIPVHWSLAGVPDRFGGKFEGLLGLPLAATGIYLALVFLPRIDPRRAHYDAFSGPYAIIRTAIVGLLLAVDIYIQLWIRGRTAGIDLFMPVLVGVMIMVLGNYLPKLKSNWFIGIRTPWTLSSEQSWRKTHQLGGWLFVACGAVIIVTSLIAPDRSRVALFGALMPTLVVTVVYSYFAWRSDPERS